MAANDDFKKIIEDLSGKRSRESLKRLRKIEENGNKTSLDVCNTWSKLHSELFPYEGWGIKTSFDNYQRVNTAVIARAEWEMLKIAEDLGDKIISEYQLKEGAQYGIVLDWDKLSKRFWIPSYFLDHAYVFAPDMKNNASCIFSSDEINQLPYHTQDGFVVGGLRGNPRQGNRPLNTLVEIVLRQEPKKKIKLLTTDEKWRESARKYSLIYLNSIMPIYEKDISEELKPALQQLISEYHSQMQ